MNSTRLHGLNKRFRLAKFILVMLGIMLWLFKDFRKSVNNALIEDAKSSSYLGDIVKHARRRARCIHPPGAKHYVVCKRNPLTKSVCGERSLRNDKLNDVDKGYRIPNIVHFIWFGEVLNVSSFIHYLALRSAASIQRPQSIYLHYNARVIVNSKYIYTTLQCISEFYSLLVNRLSSHFSRI